MTSFFVTLFPCWFFGDAGHDGNFPQSERHRMSKQLFLNVTKKIVNFETVFLNNTLFLRVLKISLKVALKKTCTYFLLRLKKL